MFKLNSYLFIMSFKYIFLNLIVISLIIIFSNLIEISRILGNENNNLIISLILP